jgi:hypothetical protein
MSLFLLQYRASSGERGVAARRGDEPFLAIRNTLTCLELAQNASSHGCTLAEEVEARGYAGVVDPEAVELLPPIDHQDPAHLLLTGTGLTHLGSAEGRDKMHLSEETVLTDSMKMFRMGIDGGKPAPGAVGVQPEWFYKGDGSVLVPPRRPIPCPDFGLDASEEPEIAGVYLIDGDGSPLRLGFCLANELSDHVTEQHNYLWLAHSKLRPAALGPELLVGELPQEITGTSRVVRNGETIWEARFLTGEKHMSHSIANLEQHHFKYDLFRRPGDIHVHFFGTATLSFSDGVATRFGDTFHIEAEPFRLPLTNSIERAVPGSSTVRIL